MSVADHQWCWWTDKSNMMGWSLLVGKCIRINHMFTEFTVSLAIFIHISTCYLSAKKDRTKHLYHAICVGFDFSIFFLGWLFWSNSSLVISVERCWSMLIHCFLGLRLSTWPIMFLGKFPWTCGIQQQHEWCCSTFERKMNGMFLGKFPCDFMWIS